eukprot:3744402-Rhodomonas_salina.1
MFNREQFGKEGISSIPDAEPRGGLTPITRILLVSAELSKMVCALRCQALNWRVLSSQDLTRYPDPRLVQVRQLCAFSHWKPLPSADAAFLVVPERVEAAPDALRPAGCGHPHARQRQPGSSLLSLLPRHAICPELTCLG